MAWRRRKLLVLSLAASACSPVFTAATREKAAKQLVVTLAIDVPSAEPSQNSEAPPDPTARQSPLSEGAGVVIGSDETTGRIFVATAQHVTCPKWSKDAGSCPEFFATPEFKVMLKTTVSPQRLKVDRLFGKNLPPWKGEDLDILVFDRRELGPVTSIWPYLRVLAPPPEVGSPIVIVGAIHGLTRKSPPAGATFLSEDRPGGDPLCASRRSSATKVELDSGQGSTAGDSGGGMFTGSTARSEPWHLFGFYRVLDDHECAGEIDIDRIRKEAGIAKRVQLLEAATPNPTFANSYWRYVAGAAVAAVGVGLAATGAYARNTYYRDPEAHEDLHGVAPYLTGVGDGLMVVGVAGILWGLGADLLRLREARRVDRLEVDR